MEYYIKTDDSYFGKINADIEPLLIECINEAKPHLILNPQLALFNKLTNQNVIVGFFSNESIGIRYAKQFVLSNPLSPSLMELLHLINNEINCDFNSVIIQELPNETHYYKKESSEDNNKEKKVFISYGTIRRFRIKDKLTIRPVINIPMCSKEILVMNNKFANDYNYEIPTENAYKEQMYLFTFSCNVYPLSFRSGDESRFYTKYK